jgi:hypothetical protein
MTFAARGAEPRSPNVISPVSAERNFWILGLEAAAVFEEQATAILNAMHKPKYQQSPSDRVVFPVDQWVQVTWHVYLHPDQGRVRIWQDDTIVVDETGPTLPFAGMLYNSLEVGISAHSFGDQTATLFVDDIVVNTDPLR